MRPSFFSARFRPAMNAPWSAGNGTGPAGYPMPNKKGAPWRSLPVSPSSR